MRRYVGLIVALVAVVAFLLGVAVSGGPGVLAGAARSVANPASASASASAPTPVRASAKPAAAPVGTVNFADVAERINPAVVNIDAASRGGHESRRHRGADDFGDSSRDFDLPRQGSGSGFIIDKQGFLLTNYHVIEDADRIIVTLADGRALNGEVVGADPAIDVALLKVSGVGGLPEAPLGNSDDLRVGEWVCAIGNPLGYVHSVTVGVVSFMGRKLFDASLDDYIQTDAAINLGNSGGPLLNARGEVIGINSAISSRATNIGFAVPINQAVAILQQLKTRGHVSRGFLGVVLTDVTPEMQRSLGLSVSRGALVQDVNERSPAERIGLRPYDIIVGVDGREVLSNEELIRDISGRQPGTVARLEVIRDGRKQTLQAKLAERPLREGPIDASPLSPRRPAVPVPSEPPLGLTIHELDAGFAKRMDIPSAIQGVVVVRVDPTGPAFLPPLRRGFVIMEINRQPVRSVADYTRIVAAARTGDALAFYGYDPSVGQKEIVMATVDAR
jgi:serine protease Do